MAKPSLEHLGEALTYLRARKQLTAAEVARKAGITPAMLSGYEHNAKTPNVGSLTKILGAMGSDFGDLDRAFAQVASEAVPAVPGMSLFGSSLDTPRTRDALREVIASLRRFCDVALSELEQETDPDETT